MRGTAPTLHCDHKDGCDRWMIDHFEIAVVNWRDLLEGWYHDPYIDSEEAYCPDHRQEAGK